MKYPSVIIVGGEAGSGKSTTVEMLAEKLGYRTIQGGEIMRALADERGVSIEEFSETAGEDPGIDKEIDQRLIEAAKSGRVIIQSRVLPFMEEVKNMDGVFTFFIDASPETRAKRVAKREGITPAEARKNFEFRERNNKKRFQEVYGLDTSDHSVYDLVVANDELSPQETLDAVLQHLEKTRN